MVPRLRLSRPRTSAPSFVLTALEQWSTDKKQKMYVVSNDGDMQSGCSNRGPLLHLKSIAEFVDLVLRAEEADFLAQFFVDNPKPIIEAVTRAFEDRYAMTGAPGLAS
jgi:hypothetical protein